MKVYPNPATDHIYIEFPAKENEKSTIQLMDLTGKVLLSHTGFCNDGINKWEMMLDEIHDGLYKLVKTETGDTISIEVAKEEV